MNRIRAIGSWALARRRALAAIVLVAVVLVAGYRLFLAADEVAPATIRIGFATAVIGEGEDSVGVTPDGEVLTDRPPPGEGTVPALPAASPPKGGRLAGTMLAQAKVLGAAPEPLRPCIARSDLGESGVDVELRSGIEIHFGDASRVDEKWAAAIAVLADPTITALDYVNVQAPNRLTTGGSGHALPAVGEGDGASCAP